MAEWVGAARQGSVPWTHMNSSTLLDGIRSHSAVLAIDAARDLGAHVEHCPEWTVADLVVHIGDVQWFWAEVVTRRVQARSELDQVVRPSDRGEPLRWFRAQTDRLVDALAACTDDVALWTWWPPSQNAGFVKRRQFNEVVVHGWDARNAVGDPRPIDTASALIGLEEFVEVMSRDLVDGAHPPRIELRCSDDPWRGVLFDESGDNASLVLEGTASELLLTLWHRSSHADDEVTAALASIDLS
jgi:uncharacterized protein (TIGR03083 family)